VSNFDEPDREAVWEIAGTGRLTCHQALYHLQERAIEQAVLPWYEKHGVAVVGYNPFGHGEFHCAVLVVKMPKPVPEEREVAAAVAPA
jgi:diketogulonate reductase-like aldo/keto reductase